jgi:hypothetical protein
VEFPHPSHVNNEDYFLALYLQFNALFMNLRFLKILTCKSKAIRKSISKKRFTLDV